MQKKIRLTQLTTRAIEAIRSALETLHDGARIEFMEVDIDPQVGYSQFEDLNVVAVYSLNTGTEDCFSAVVSITMEKRDGLWRASSAKLRVSYGQVFYLATWHGQRVFVDCRQKDPGE